MALLFRNGEVWGILDFDFKTMTLWRKLDTKSETNPCFQLQRLDSNVTKLQYDPNRPPPPRRSVRNVTALWPNHTNHVLHSVLLKLQPVTVRRVLSVWLACSSTGQNGETCAVSKQALDPEAKATLIFLIDFCKEFKARHCRWIRENVIFSCANE